LRFDLKNRPLVDIQVRNPVFPIQAKTWVPETLPVTRRTNLTEFTLTSLKPWPVECRQSFLPELQIFQEGEIRRGWYYWWTQIHDATGNSQGGSLCPYEPVWQLEIDVYRTAKAPFLEHETFRLTNINIPLPGEILRLDRRHQFTNTSITVVALCGVGDFRFSNQVCVASSPGQYGQRDTWNFSASPGATTFEFRSGRPFLLAEFDPPFKRQELYVRARLHDGRLYPLESPLEHHKVHRFFLPKEVLSNNNQDFEIELVQQRPIKLQYVVSPLQLKTNGPSLLPFEIPWIFPEP
jgi:hypothetical protein